MTVRRKSSRDLAQETAPLEAPSKHRLAIYLVGDARGAIPIDKSLRIGRDPSSEVRVDDDSVSRFHAIIELGEPPMLRDLESRNGTWVAGGRLAPGGSAVLAEGTTVRVGDAVLIVDRERAMRAAAATPATAGLLRSTEGAMGAVFALADRLAQDDISVLLLGETGVGKEVVAHYLHAQSPRAAGPFVPVHAAALTASLFESELFGHERGAFTGAAQERPGLFEMADGGTLFFDEIGELPLEMQPKLLRILEDRRVTRVGGRAARAVDVRIVAATNRDLAREAARGAFRSDLYFRLSAFPLAIPPLRERKAEIAPLAKALLSNAAAERGRSAPALSRAAELLLEGYAWPGNVRELKSVLIRSLLLAPPSVTTLDADDVARTLRPRTTPVESAPSDAAGAHDDEKRRIVDALSRHAGNQAAAAADLGIARRTLLYKLDRLGIARPRKGKSGS